VGRGCSSSGAAIPGSNDRLKGVPVPVTCMQDRQGGGNSSSREPASLNHSANGTAWPAGQGGGGQGSSGVGTMQAGGGGSGQGKAHGSGSRLQICSKRQRGALVEKERPVKALVGVRMVWVSKEHRRKGIATKLLDAAR
jgi:hypothetical protein